MFESCPRCYSKIGPPLKSGRQVCSNCGWSDVVIERSPQTGKPIPGNQPSQSPAKPTNKTGAGNIIALFFRIIRRFSTYIGLIIRQKWTQFTVLFRKKKSDPNQKQGRSSNLWSDLSQKLSRLEETIPTAETLDRTVWMTAEIAFNYLGGDVNNPESEITSTQGDRAIKFSQFKRLIDPADYTQFGLECHVERRRQNKPWLRLLPSK
ncbi:hypothetical protein L3556_08980 [Candidatus Synechococcus calcipolaris G9]|uniref:Uncharacterized protein n=1 Tax=Candidatus Synechococcus calcipolaris G9 TaxID=1497997 RepID=A0ABT6EZQ8_9SYNE|nr:hypothetical protein [Candidatus Synechococcus calcipolaris]MDG2991057.1 hypothetical protein [Candidatus Synechococcus calcipolaris G9]